VLEPDDLGLPGLVFPRGAERPETRDTAGAVSRERTLRSLDGRTISRIEIEIEIGIGIEMLP
jgi:hypothetical protein